MLKTIRNILLALLAILIVIQFISIDKTNPPSNPDDDYLASAQPSPSITTLLKDACYDCHSNHTEYPWYTNIQPVAWWVKNHINHGRKELNFSEWETYSAKKKAHKMEECFELIESKEMPLFTYIWMHKEAKLNETQRLELVDWFKSEEQRYK